MTRLLPAQRRARCRGPGGHWLLRGEYAAAVGRWQHGARARAGGAGMGRQWRRRPEEAGAGERADPAAAAAVLGASL